MTRYVKHLDRLLPWLVSGWAVSMLAVLAGLGYRSALAGVLCVG